jgi:chemotaxis family two-component system response regulator Rcp1
VEDSPAEVHIVQRALKDLGKSVNLLVARDGQEAMDALLHCGGKKGGKNNRPHLVLLDLNLPRLSGLEVLEQVRGQPDLQGLPVVLWSTSRKVEDIRAGYLAGANSFFEKPREYSHLRNVLDAILHYWFESALMLPP